MARDLNSEIEACSCAVCRSDLAYIAPCMKSDEWNNPVVVTAARDPKKLAA